MHHGKDIKNIALIGFPATGKSIVAKKVAAQLNWDSVDTDDEIVKLSGRTIPELFEEGEDKFRQFEREVLKRACCRGKVVISTGGGIILDPRNVELLHETCIVICLEAKVEMIYHRLLQDALYSSNPVMRPLLAGKEPLERIKQLKAFRQPYYAIADWTVHTDNLTTDEVSHEVLKGWRYTSHFHDVEQVMKADTACIVETSSRHYPFFAGWGLLSKLGEKMGQAGLSGNAIIISDETVFSIYGDQSREAIRNSGFSVDYYLVPPGEASKDINAAVKIYDFLIKCKVERNDVIVALGGGVVGDLVGFVAATYLRGVPWVQVPTSLVGMVDASIGGKVAVDHPQGKNLIGAFYQPCLVLADVQVLTSLPQREFASGWAEVIKHGLISDAEFFKILEDNVEKLISLTPDITTNVIARSACIKARIVAEDERDTGKRITLNYGHTVAHGLETASHYKKFLHGEAVAIGMMAAAKLSQRLGLLPQNVVQRQQSLLEKFNLPVNCSGVSLDDALAAMELDKKVRNKAIQWVLLEDIGKVIIRTDVSNSDVLNILKEVIKT
jgi:shikimate kinase/3-dehydroquinate synthase